MKTSSSRRHPAGFVSYLLVLSTGAILTLLTIYTYKRAIGAQQVEAQVQLRIDYSEKEEAILRSIVAIAPNRAIRAMQTDSNASSANRNPLRWQEIFSDSLAQANARTSVSASMVSSLNIPNLKVGNSGDAALGDPARMFAAHSSEAGYVSSGLNRSLGTGYPVPLSSSSTDTNTRDALYPIVSNLKLHGTLAQSGVGLPVATYPLFNVLKYPNINFGYATPGADFVAKRNWWAFSLDVADHDDDLTRLARPKRNFVLSIYEIPSQLSISASSFMSLGQYASGEAWQNVNIDGGLFVGKVSVEDNTNTPIKALASRRGMTFSSNSKIDGQSLASNPFAAGVREEYQVTTGPFFPVSLSTESGRAAFIPINRGADYFDRFAHTAETNVLSTTTWNNYTIGALQCAMRLDVTKTVSSTDLTPTQLRFSYLLSNGTRSQDMYLTLSTTDYPTTLPAGYVKICNENQSFDLSTLSSGPVDVAYGVSGGWTFRQDLTGSIAFNNATFGDPKVGTVKGGYWRPRAAHRVRQLPSGQTCIAVYPERLPAFLAAIVGAGSTAINNSLAVNVDYSVTGLNNPARMPLIPCTNNDYGLTLQECADLTAFTKGFSLVTNLRLYIGDDFNIVSTAPRAGYTPAVTPSNPQGLYYPPCSLFAPEKRYGVDGDAPWVDLRGQIGSLASDTVANAVRPLDSKNMSGQVMTSSQIKVNLTQIRDPSELPPITMMNWLVLLEERRKEFY